MNNSESGRKLNQAVNTTSKAVGGAILQAKGALSNWWSAMTTQPPIVAESDTTPDPTSTAPTEHTANDNTTHDEDESFTNTQHNSSPKKDPDDEIGQSNKSFGVVEIGHEAVTALESNTPGKVFTV